MGGVHSGLFDTSDWPVWAASIADAAAVTGISRATLHKWKKQGAWGLNEADRKVNLAAVMAWCDRYGKGERLVWTR